MMAKEIVEDAAEQPLEETAYFTCAMDSGTLVVVDTAPDGRLVYECETCHASRLTACSICKHPKANWVDDGEICIGCGMRAMTGGLSLNAKQVAGMLRWVVVIGSPE